MNQSRRRSHRNRRRSNRKRGGASDISPAPTNYSTVSANPQPSERVMQWATTAGAPMPPAAQMRNVAHGGRRTRRCKKRIHHRCRHSRRRRSH